MPCEFGASSGRGVHQVLNDIVERLFITCCIPNCFCGVSVFVSSNEIPFLVVSLHEFEAIKDCKSVPKTLLIHSFGCQRAIGREPFVSFDDLNRRSTTSKHPAFRASTMDG